MKSDSLKDKLIIVAEHDKESATKIGNALVDNGYSNLCIVDSGIKAYEVLRPYFNCAEDVGLLIINSKLPHCQLMEMCRTLTGATDPGVIPFIILYDDESDKGGLGNTFNIDLSGQNLIYAIEKTDSYKELLLVVDFQLRLKQERLIRFKQEKRLRIELADRKVVDTKLQYLVAHDELTGLLNRSHFELQLRKHLKPKLKSSSQGALLFIDIDRFGVINELEGFEQGDRLLFKVVQIIRRTLANNFLFSRFGSDEFCLYLDDKNEDQAVIYAEKIRNAVETLKFFTGDACYTTSVSIGISTVKNLLLACHANELILRARQACNTAKENGRNLVWLFNEKDDQFIKRRQDICWVPVIKKALQEKRLFLVFQPVIEIETETVSRYEVLLRMRADDGSIILPGQFIPAAERMGLIHHIDLWVVETSIDFLANLPTNKNHISLAVNLSGVAFQDEALLPTISNKLKSSAIDAGRLTFEITETAAVESFEKTRIMIKKIRALGCKFALDDFGAGFCSFNYLKKFPVDYVKIDGQFIQNLADDETDQILVKSMVQIAKKLGKKTIAEFVDTPLVIEHLKRIGVDYGQGYIFGKPEEALLESDKVCFNQLEAVYKNNIN